MSQRDVVAEIRAAEVEAPAELRERVRLIAATAPPERHGFFRQRCLFSRRRLVAVLVPVAAAVAVAVVVTRPTSHPAAVVQPFRSEVAPTITAEGKARAAAAPSAQAGSTAHVAPIAPSTTRPQKYSASLTLRVPNATAVSDATKRAVSIVSGLGGYVVSAHVDAASRNASSELVLKVPKTKVRTGDRTACRHSARSPPSRSTFRISQAGIATTDRTMQRLQRPAPEPASRAGHARRHAPDRCAHHPHPAPAAHRSRRAPRSPLRHRRPATGHAAAPAPPTHHGHGPLHGLGKSPSAGSGSAPSTGSRSASRRSSCSASAGLGVRTIRRRRENALLSRP